LGIPVYDADSRAKWLMNNESALVNAIKALLGEEAYTLEGLDTQFVSAKVFNNPPLLTALNKLVHPAVADDAGRWQLAQKAPYTVREAALLIEAGSYKELDKLILVTAPQDVRALRVQARNLWTMAQIQARMDNQMPEEKKVPYADYIIPNDGSISVIHKVLALHQEFLALAKASS
jgi:dephospho-CoA kinase